MSQLASRKKLLVAESELNRAQLAHDWQTMADDIHALKNQARTISSLASAAAALVAGIASFRRKPAVTVDEKPSWLQTILKGAGLASKLLGAFRSQAPEQKDK